MQLYNYGVLYKIFSGIKYSPLASNYSDVYICFIKGVMVRLMLVLAPVMCILSGIAVSSTLTTYMKNLDASRKDKKAKKADINYPVKNEVKKSYNKCYCSTCR